MFEITWKLEPKKRIIFIIFLEIIIFNCSYYFFIAHFSCYYQDSLETWNEKVHFLLFLNSLLSFKFLIFPLEDSYFLNLQAVLVAYYQLYFLSSKQIQYEEGEGCHFYLIYQHLLPIHLAYYFNLSHYLLSPLGPSKGVHLIHQLHSFFLY